VGTRRILIAVAAGVRSGRFSARYMCGLHAATPTRAAAFGTRRIPLLEADRSPADGRRGMAKGVRVAATAWALVAALLAVAPVVAAEPARAGECRVLVHDGLPLDGLTRKVVTGIFLGDIRFVGQVRVLPITYGEGSAAERDFVEQCLGISAPAFRLNWVRLVFREGTAPPRSVNTTANMVAVVDTTPGAVGYLDPDGDDPPRLPARVHVVDY